MFERFGRDARLAVVAAQGVARSANDTQIRAVHLLAGLTRQASTGDLLKRHGVSQEDVARWIAGPHGGGLDRSALSALAIDLDAVRNSVESTFGAGALDADPPRHRWRPFGRRRGPSPGHIPFTPSAKKCLELSLREALRLGLTSIDAESVLLGILRSDDRQVCQVLADLDVNAVALRRAAEDSLLRAA